MNTDLLARLARQHVDANSVFRGWNDAWLNPAFRDWNIEGELGKITCPVLAMQGVDDEYGTLEQIYRIADRVTGARAVAIEGCVHSPHRDQPEVVGREAARFIRASDAVAGRGNASS